MSIFQFKKFSVKQENSSMKVGTDAVLLGCWTQLRKTDKQLLEVGTGCGVISLIIAQRYNFVNIDAIDIDKASILDAKDNFNYSPWNNRLSAINDSLQTYNPDNEVLNYVINNDFNGFYNYEMNLRRLLKYPPYYYLVSLKIVSSDYDKALNESKNIANYLKKNLNNTSIVLGPTTHNLFKYNNMYRFVIVIKYRFDDKLKKTLKEIDELYMFNNDVKVEIDFNPYHI